MIFDAAYSDTMLISALRALVEPRCLLAYVQYIKYSGNSFVRLTVYPRRTGKGIYVMRATDLDIRP